MTSPIVTMAGEILQPFSIGDGFKLCRLVHKIESDLADDEVRSRVDLRIVERHFSELAGRCIRWIFAAHQHRMTPQQSQILDRSSFFRFLPEDHADSVRAVLCEKRFDFGDLIVREGEEADACYILVNGRARVVKEFKGGQEIVLATLRPGDQLASKR